MTKPSGRVVCIDNHSLLGEDDDGNLSAPKPGETLEGLLSIGSEYELLGEEDGFFRVVADDGDDYLFPKEMFRIVQT
jgi:hypothetical protein